MPLTKLLALWGGGAVLVTGAATVALLSTATAAPASSGTVTSSANNGNGKGGGNNGKGGGNGAGGATPPAKALTVSHEMIGILALGRPATIRVTVDNPNNQAVTLTSVDGTLTGVQSSAGDTPECTTSMFNVIDWTGSTTIAKKGSTTADLVVQLVDSSENQDRCKSATYSFSFVATANQA